MALYDGTVQDRYDREWMQLTDDRKVRGLDYQETARRTAEFVDPDTDTSVTATGDNDPAGFVQLDFEATLEYNPNA